MKTSSNKKLFRISALVLLVALTAFQAMAKPSIDVSTEDRPLPAFNSIKLICSADIILEQGNTQKVTVKADSDIIQYLETRVENGVLVVDVSKNRLYNIHVLELHITMPQLEKLESSGSGDVVVKGKFSGNNLYVKLNGSGDFKADLNMTNMEVDINGSGDADFNGVKGQFKLSIRGSGDVSARDLQLETCNLSSIGSGDIELAGNAVDLTASQMGSGDVNAYGLKAVNVIATNNGSGDMVVTVVESLQAKLNGSGDLTYNGNPAKVKVTANGSGEVYSR